MQLTIDTSTDTASIAIIQNNEVLAELAWRCQQNHTVELLPRLAQLLNNTKVALQSISCIIVAKGPGSFTGLRVGISTAKGLAFSLGIPIIGISTLEVEAYQHAEIEYLAIRSLTDLIVAFSSIVIGLMIIPLSARLTRLISACCASIVMFLWMTPIPPS